MPSIVYASIPRANGMFSFYRNLRAGLKTLGWEVRCVTVGAQEHALWDPNFADEGCIALAPYESDLQQQVNIFLDWCEKEAPDIVMPMDSQALLAALPRLPLDTQVVTRCAFTSDYGYQLATQSLDRIACVVALTPRHVTELNRYYRVPPEKIALIRHGVDLRKFSALDRYYRENGAPLRIAFLGRLEHDPKGVMYIPAIVEELERLGIAYRLQIAGSGPDRQAIMRRLEQPVRDGRVLFMGTIPARTVPDFLTKADIFLFTSQEEGFSNSLMEAMAAGCVPIASRIEGVTDFIITDQESGVLCPIGDNKAFAQAIASLYKDHARFKRMSQAAEQTIKDQFNWLGMAAEYADLFNRVVASEPCCAG